MMRRKLFVATALATLLMAIPTASAQSEGTDDAELEAQGVWDPAWPEFRWWEYVGTGVLLAEAFTVRFALEWKEEANWTGGVLADDWALDEFRADDPQNYDRWVVAGDIPFYASLGWAALDPVLSGAASGDWHAAGQMTLMNLEAFAVYTSLLWTTQYFVRRQRPQARLCDDEELANRRDVSCEGPDRYRSFLGGHTGVVATNAALTCLHHTQMDLYGDVGDATVCGAWVAATGVTFVSRTVTGKHYLSDNVLGLGLGALSGLLVPYALHYGHDHMDVGEDEDPPPPIDGARVTGASVSPSLTGLTLKLNGTLSL